MITSEPIILSFKNVTLTNEQFYQLCQDNENWQLERTVQGELVIMPPVGGVSGNRESDLNGELWFWNRQTQLGKVFSFFYYISLTKWWRSLSRCCLGS